MVNNKNIDDKIYLGMYFFDRKLTDSEKELIQSLYEEYLHEGLEGDLALKKAIAVFKMFNHKRPGK